MHIPHIIFLFSIFVSPALFPAQSAHDAAKTVGLTLMSNVEMRKAQKAELEKMREEYKRKAEESEKSTNKSLARLSVELNDIQQKLRTAPEAEIEMLNKIIALLHDRKQNLMDLNDQWREYLEHFDQHITLLDEVIAFFKTAQHDLKSVYSWKEFRDAQIRIAEHTVKIDNEKVKRDNLKKQRLAVVERLSSWEKQLSVKQKDRKKMISHYNAQDDSERVSSAVFQLQNDVLSHELNALEENLEHGKLRLLSIDFGTKLWDDIIGFEADKLSKEKDILVQIENRLVLDYNDVEIAKADWKVEAQAALLAKEQINEQREPKKQAKEKTTIELDFLREKYAKAKVKDIHDKADLYLTKLQIRQFLALIKAQTKELELLDAKKDLADLRVDEKELQFSMIELRYKLKIEPESFGELLTAFENKRDLAASSLKMIKDHRTESITHLIDTNRLVEKINNQQNELKAKRHAHFKANDAIMREIAASFDATKKNLMQQLEHTQALLAVNADLISHQEKILNQYDLIISELESRIRTFGVWKRSPRAISLHSLERALVQAESFFKKLYWETPGRMKLSAFVTFAKSFTWDTVLMLLLSICVYLVVLFCLRLLLRALQIRFSKNLSKYQGHTFYLYLSLALAVTEFVLEHFVLIFSWFYVLLHINFDFQYIFSALQPMVSEYSIALFYLISVPILAYLAREFVSNLKDLNRKLSYLFFAETFQDKFIFLVMVFCYATAFLIPLKCAFLAYTQEVHTEFATLIVAAYSLILILVLLFFFSKEDILKLVPSHTSFLIWLKRKIDRHYYPVFIFVMSLFILSNPYIGYSNLAWFLAFAVPASTLLFYALFIAHHYIRKYAVFLFMKEDEDEIFDKFEHAKAYYGFFVIFSFLVLLFGCLIVFLHIWGFNYTPSDLIKFFSEHWVIRVGIEDKLGVVELLTLGLFVAAGFLVSSMLHRFMLSRLFDILRTEPGTQNTISRILHYTTVFLSLLLGLNAIHLQQFIFWVGAPFGIVLGLALKDIASDLVAGFFVLIERPIEIGNFVQIENIQGTVHKIAPRSTTIITSRNHSIIIPNKDLVTKWISNWGHGRFAVGFEINVRVDCAADVDLVKKTLLNVVAANQFVLKVPAIVVRLEDIETDALYFLVRAFISARRVKEQWEVAAALRMEMLKAFSELKIKLARPSRILYGAGQDEDSKAFEIKFDR